MTGNESDVVVHSLSTGPSTLTVYPEVRLFLDFFFFHPKVAYDFFLPVHCRKIYYFVCLKHFFFQRIKVAPSEVVYFTVSAFDQSGNPSEGILNSASEQSNGQVWLLTKT